MHLQQHPLSQIVLAGNKNLATVNSLTDQVTTTPKMTIEVF